MTKLKWHSGPPPHVGWWHCKNPCSKPFGDWRFWNGEHWSYFCDSKSSRKTANWCAKMQAIQQIHEIWWCDYYPANARVPRRKP